MSAPDIPPCLVCPAKIDSDYVDPITQAACDKDKLVDSYGSGYQCLLRPDLRDYDGLDTAYTVATVLYAAVLVLFSLRFAYLRSPRTGAFRAILVLLVSKTVAMGCYREFYVQCDLETGVCWLWSAIAAVVTVTIAGVLTWRLLLFLSAGFAMNRDSLTREERNRVTTRVLLFSFSFICHVLFQSWFSLLMVFVLYTLSNDIIKNATWTLRNLRQHLLMFVRGGPGDVDGRQTSVIFAKQRLYRTFILVFAVTVFGLIINAVLAIFLEQLNLVTIATECLEFVVVLAILLFARRHVATLVPVFIPTYNSITRLVEPAVVFMSTDALSRIPGAQQLPGVTATMNDLSPVLPGTDANLRKVVDHMCDGAVQTGLFQGRSATGSNVVVVGPSGERCLATLEAGSALKPFGSPPSDGSEVAFPGEVVVASPPPRTPGAPREDEVVVVMGRGGRPIARMADGSPVTVDGVRQTQSNTPPAAGAGTSAAVQQWP